MYLKYIQEEAISASVNEFSWDLKYAGAQILLTKVLNLNQYQTKNYLYHINRSLLQHTLSIIEYKNYD